MDQKKSSALEAALAGIERQFGKGSIMRLGEAAGRMQVETVSSGILSLDLALGVGGVPRGRVVEIYGPESGGKTTVALHIVAEVQKAGGIAAFIDAEHALDPAYAERLGVNIGLENVWNWFLADPVAMKVFIDQYNHPRVGCYFDVANCLVNGYPEHWIDLLAHRVKAVHFKNYKRNDDCGGGMHGFGEELLDGDVNWKNVTDALARIGYEGAVTAELIPFCRLPDMTLPDVELARKNAPQLRRILGRA